MPNLEKAKELRRSLEAKKAVNYNHFEIRLGGDGRSCECSTGGSSGYLKKEIVHNIYEEVPSVGNNVENASSSINFSDDFNLNYDSSVNFTKQGEIVVGMVGAKYNYKTISNVFFNLPCPNFKMQNSAKTNEEIEFPKVQIFQRDEVVGIVNDTIQLGQKYEDSVLSCFIKNKSLMLSFGDINEYGVDITTIKLGDGSSIAV